MSITSDERLKFESFFKSYIKNERKYVHTIITVVWLLAFVSLLLIWLEEIVLTDSKTIDLSLLILLFLYITIMFFHALFIRYKIIYANLNCSKEQFDEELNTLITYNHLKSKQIGDNFLLIRNNPALISNLVS